MLSIQNMLIKKNYISIIQVVWFRNLHNNNLHWNGCWNTADYSKIKTGLICCTYSDPLCSESHTHTYAWLGTSSLLIVGAIWPHPQQQSTNSPQQQIRTVPECALFTQNRFCPFRRQQREAFSSYSIFILLSAFSVCQSHNYHIQHLCKKSAF